MPVVGYLQESPAPFSDFYLDLGCAGVEAVLDQLFGDIGRAFYHLTGGDFGGYILGKELNGHSAVSIPFLCAIVGVKEFTRVPHIARTEEKRAAQWRSGTG